jgi:hypothetical protein
VWNQHLTIRRLVKTKLKTNSLIQAIASLNKWRLLELKSKRKCDTKSHAGKMQAI